MSCCCTSCICSAGPLRDLQRSQRSAALEKLYRVDNNAYAFMFSAAVYEHFTQATLHQRSERLQWAAGRLVGHENLYDTVTSLLRKQARGECDDSAEIAALSAAIERQRILLSQTLIELNDTVCGLFPLEAANLPMKQETMYPHGQ